MVEGRERVNPPLGKAPTVVEGRWKTALAAEGRRGNPVARPSQDSCPSPNADLARGDDSERSNQVRGTVAAYLDNDFRLRHVGQACEAKENHPGVHETLAEHQVAKVLVCCQQDGAASVGLLQDLLIRNAGRQLGHVSNVMTILS